MKIIHGLDFPKLGQANDPLTADDVVMVKQPRAGYVMWELGEQGPQLPIGTDPRDHRGSK